MGVSRLLLLLSLLLLLLLLHVLHPSQRLLLHILAIKELGLIPVPMLLVPAEFLTDAEQTFLHRRLANDFQPIVVVIVDLVLLLTLALTLTIAWVLEVLVIDKVEVDLTLRVAVSQALVI